MNKRKMSVLVLTVNGRTGLPYELAIVAFSPANNPIPLGAPSTRRGVVQAFLEPRLRSPDHPHRVAPTREAAPLNLQVAGVHLSLLESVGEAKPWLWSTPS